MYKSSVVANILDYYVNAFFEALPQAQYIGTPG